MASREKRPLAPSKSKQKASESSISSPDIKTKKGKTLPNLRQQTARDILEAVATGSQLPPKLEASLPRKKALEKLKRNQKLRSKVTLIKAKQKVVPIKNARRINSEAKKTVKPRKVKQSASADAKVNETGVKGAENSNANADNNEGKGTEANVKSAKIVKTVKKSKATKSVENNETGESQNNKETIVSKVKTGKKQSDTPKSGGKTVKAVGKKIGGTKETGNQGVLMLWETKGTKPKKNLAKESGESTLVRNPVAVKAKTYSEDKNSIDLTIEEVIASMLSDPELEESEEKEDIKPSIKSKKMLVGERSFCDIDIKNEMDCDDDMEARDDSTAIFVQNTMHMRRKLSTPIQRSLRNGKRLQLSDSGISMDIEMKKRGRLNSDDHSLEQENTLDGNIDNESCFSESSGNESRVNVPSSKDNLPLNKEEKLNHVDEIIQFVSEIENNNNGDEADGDAEAGPTLRSKVKTRNSDETLVDEVKMEDSKAMLKLTDLAEDSKKSINLDILKKERIYTKIGDTPRSRRNSLNTDVKKLNPFAFSSEKNDGSSRSSMDPSTRSQIDQMIETIKLTIARSIERKIYGEEKGRALEVFGKSFDMSKMDEIVTPLSAEGQKSGSEEETPNDSQQEVKAENSENSVPKVADTAKEIEKLVMGENQSVDSQSQKKNVDSSNTSIKDDRNIQDLVHQTTSKDPAEDSTANSIRIAQSDSDVGISKKSSRNANKLEENVDVDSLKKPGRSKTSEDCSSEKTDCIDKVIMRRESTHLEDDLLDTSNLTGDSDTSIVLNLSSLSDDEENAESFSVKFDSTVDNSMTQVPLSEIRVAEQGAESHFKAVSCPKKSNEQISSEKEVVHKNNHLLTDGCDNDTATSAQAKLTHSSSETEKIKASNNDSSLIVSNKESSSTSSSSSAKVEGQQKPDKSEVPKNSKEDEHRVVEDNKRVLRGREKQKKADSKQSNENADVKIKDEEKSDTSLETQSNGSILSDDKISPANKAQNISKDDCITEVPVRTRRTRETKKPVANTNLKPKRNRKEVKKSEQQNKEETLLDNEVAKINENKYRKSVAETKTPRGCSVPSTNVDKNQTSKNQDNTSSNRSKSENDLENMQNSRRSNARNGDNFMPKDSNNVDDEKATKSPDNKDSDEASTSGESLSSIIQETPEEKARKESVFRLLGLESWEKVNERLNHQKARKEQTSGTLKMRIPKGREKDKTRSRSPLKMVLKQGRADGEGDSPEFYTIQKECGTSVGESSSGANRKLTTNHRHSCDEDNEESQSKDRQSLVIPEKSSSFSIHPGRCCGDVCCYCFGKFGSLDTPMHLAQMKSDERRQKILNLERHLTKDSCLCDACYRHIDRKANQSPTNIQTKPQKQHRPYLVPKCCARGCIEPARHHVRRRWLQKVKLGLRSEVDINWESNHLTSMSFCINHYSKVAKFLNCGLCKRRLQKAQSVSLNIQETIEVNQRFMSQGMDIPTTAGTFVCKLCRCFISLELKYKGIDNMQKNNREFYKKYKAKILSSRLTGEMDNDMDDMPTNQEPKDKDKEKRKKIKCSTQTKTSVLNAKPSNSPDVGNLTNTGLEKSVAKTNKDESSSPITVIGRGEESTKSNAKTPGTGNSETTVRNDVQFVAIEKTIEKLKKRKAMEALSYAGNSESSDGANVVEILAMDKEVTLTRLPKKPRTSSDITPVVQRLGANPSISVRTLFPGEEEMNLHANVEFGNVREVTPQGWEKCATMIQYDRDTKVLWQELQRPYGNQSSFLRHLILLEKYYRAGDLVLAPNASRNAINYSTSVHNRLISYEGPEKVDEPIMEPVTIDYTNARRLSGGFVVERDRVPPTNTTTSFLTTSTPNLPSTSQASKMNPARTMKLSPGVSIMKKPPTLQRMSFPSTSGGSVVPSKRKDPQKSPMPQYRRGKMYEMNEMDYKRLMHCKQQKQQTLLERNSRNTSNGPAAGPLPGLKPVSQNQKTHFVPQTQFQKHLRMQQEMLNRQSRSDFEPLVCDMRQLSNENTPTQNFLGNLNLPKSIQVTTKPSNPIPILPKIPKSLTVIPQTVPRPAEK